MIFTRVEARSSALDLQHQTPLARLENLRDRCSGSEGGPGDFAIRQRRESSGLPAHSPRLLQHRWPRVMCAQRLPSNVSALSSRANPHKSVHKRNQLPFLEFQRSVLRRISRFLATKKVSSEVHNRPSGRWNDVKKRLARHHIVDAEPRGILTVPRKFQSRLARSERKSPYHTQQVSIVVKLEGESLFRRGHRGFLM